MNTNLAQELLERHTVAINVAVEDGSCFMVSEQDALDAIRAALSHATSIDVQVGLPPLPPVDGYDKRIQGHYSAQQMQDYARAALAATGKQQVGGFPWENFPAYLIDKCEGGTISEEGIQRAVADMAKDSRYATVQQVGEVEDERFPGGFADAIAYVTELEELAETLHAKVFGHESDGESGASTLLQMTIHQLDEKSEQVGEVHGDALVDTARRNIRQFISKASFSSSVDKQAALSCVDVLEAALASRQPVGAGVAEGKIKALRDRIEWEFRTVRSPGYGRVLHDDLRMILALIDGRDAGAGAMQGRGRG